MSGGLAPSKSTVYVGNLPFHLTNNDIHQVFEKFGKIIKVTILRDKQTRESKGVAFIQFIDRDSAIGACKGINQKQLFDRTIKCVIAKDNGRTAEFIKKKEYPDKSYCYECMEYGHLSYNCPNNFLGKREPPIKKEKKFRRSKNNSDEYYNNKGGKRKAEEEVYEEESDDDNQGEDLRLSSLSAVIESEANRGKSYNNSYPGEGSSSSSFSANSSTSQKKRLKKSSYFSDEEEEVDG